MWFGRGKKYQTARYCLLSLVAVKIFRVVPDSSDIEATIFEKNCARSDARRNGNLGSMQRRNARHRAHLSSS